MTNLCDMPPELIRLITERADTRSRCSLRRCSKPLRQIVKNSKHVCEQIIVEHDGLKVSIQVNDNAKCSYIRSGGGCKIRKLNPLTDFNYIKTLMDGETYLGVAVNDLMKILVNPRIMVKKLEIRRPSGRPRDSDQLIPILSQELTQLSHRLQVEQCTLGFLSERDILRILPCFEPGTLKVLDLSERMSSDRLRGIVQLEQWKQAVKLRSNVLPPILELLHFKQVEVCEQFLGDPHTVTWNELRNFIENVICQAEPKQFRCSGLITPHEFIEYTRIFEKIEGTDKFILKNLENGNKLVLIRHDNYIEINKYDPNQ